MNALHIHLFGEFRVRYSDQLNDLKLTLKLKTLLAFLTLHPHRLYPRDILIDLCWGEHAEEQARGCLNTALWRLRRILSTDEENRGCFLITTPSGEIGFNRESMHWIDLTYFETSTSRLLMIPPSVMQPAEVEELHNTLTLYTGELLEGFYDDWALRERERLRQIYLNCLVQLMRYQQHQHSYEKSISYGLQILHLEPLREDVHREVMRLYQANSQRPLALRQYQICCEALDAELGVEPMEETQALNQQIMSGVTLSVQSIPPVSKLSQQIGEQDREILIKALQRLDFAILNLHAAHEDLRLAIQLVEHCKNAL